MTNTQPTTPQVSSDSSADEQLLRSIVARDEQALSDLINVYGRQVSYLCRRICGDEAEVSSLVSEVFWEVWCRASDFDPARSSLRTFLMLIARSRAIDWRRAHQTRLRVHQAHAEQSLASTRIVRECEQPSQAAIEKENQTQVCLAVDTLPQDQRTVIELAFFDGFTHEEIARKLQQPLGTVKTRIRTGLKKLRRVLTLTQGADEES